MGDTPLLERVKALAPLVEASADEMERRAALTDEVAAAIRESGALHLMVPAEMGGDELGIVDDIEVFEELARQDGSVGWSTMAASVSTTFAAIYTSDDVAEGLFGTDREAVLAGQLAPMGRAEVDGDGYVVSGSYRFGSGSDQTTHMLAGCLVFRDGEMVMRPNGMPDVVAAVIPNDHVEFKGNWDVMGLSGTASVDYEVAPIRVGGGEVFSIFTEVPERGSDVHRLGVTVHHRRRPRRLGARGGPSGPRRAGLDRRHQGPHEPGAPRPAAGVPGRLRRGRGQGARRPGVRDGVVRRRRGRRSATAATCRPKANHLARLSATWATEACAEAVEWAYREAGTEALRNPSVLGRCLRDMNAATQHVMVGRKTLTDAALALLPQP